MTYAEQLLHPNWQQRRTEIWIRDNFTCQHCGSKEITLQVHHIKYLSGLMAWEYPDELLTTLCIECHETTEALKKLIPILKRSLTNFLRLDVIDIYRVVFRRVWGMPYSERIVYLTKIKDLLDA